MAQIEASYELNGYGLVMREGAEDKQHSDAAYSPCHWQSFVLPYLMKLYLTAF
jgi:hypothetical protein